MGKQMTAAQYQAYRQTDEYQAKVARAGAMLDAVRAKREADDRKRYAANPLMLKALGLDK